MIAVKKRNQSLVCTRLLWLQDATGWATLIGRGLPMICSDWMDLGVTDASSLMPLRHNSRHTKPPTALPRISSPTPRPSPTWEPAMVLVQLRVKKHENIPVPGSVGGRQLSLPLALHYKSLEKNSLTTSLQLCDIHSSYLLNWGTSPT